LTSLSSPFASRDKRRRGERPDARRELSAQARASPDEGRAQVSARCVPAVATDTMRGVPTISRFLGISIAMFFDDHGPPHFHARHSEGSGKVQIDTLEVIDSSLGRRQQLILEAAAVTVPA
jgi:Domain of unknown function (DUF4160)